MGLGKDLSLSSQMIAGGALINDGRIVHLEAFHLTAESTGGRSPRQYQMTRASRRRRAH